MKKTLFEEWNLTYGASQQELLDQLQEQLMLARLEERDQEAEIQKAIQQVEDPFALSRHRFFSYQGMGAEWEEAFLKAWIQKEENHALEENPKDFLKRRESLFLSRFLGES